jgi:GTPase
MDQAADVADGAGVPELAPPVLSAQEAFAAQVEHALETLKVELSKVGEALVVIGGPDGVGPPVLTQQQLTDILQRLQKDMDAVEADITVLRQRSMPGTSSDVAETWTADVLLRLRAKYLVRSPSEIRVAIIGNVDSGKSTMVGVLTRSILDDGRGLARSKVFKHSHEEATGRTSSIGQHNLCLDSKGHILNDTMFRSTTSADYISHSSKVVTLVDLAGHERYFKTTAYGLTGHLPDYACLIVGANAGVVGMCKEHMGVALALKVPVFFVVTKVDICPEHVLKHTLSTLHAILKKPGVKKKPFMVRTADDVLTCARHMHTDSLAPVFLTSSVTGQGLNLVRMFYNLLPQRVKWHDRANEYAEFIIDETFGVPGVGTVIAGTVKKGVISTNTPLLLGPTVGDGSFQPTAIKSIHYKRLPAPKVVAGQTAAFALKKVKRSQVRKGMVLVDERAKPHACWEFDADIAILTHSTTIQMKYQAVIHCEIVRQAAKVVAMDRERLRSGDRACVRFRFLQRPEYLTPGTRLVFREGKTKGIGIVVGTQ